MKKELAKFVLAKLKLDLSTAYADFFNAMRDGLELTEEDYKHHYIQLGLTQFNIDRCESIADLERLHARGELDLAGDHFSDFVYNTILSMEK